MRDTYIIAHESSEKYGVSRASNKILKKYTISKGMTYYVTMSTASKSVIRLRP